MPNHAETLRTIDLGYEQLLVFDGGPQGRLRVLYGATWLTEEDRPGDRIVRAGDDLPLHRGRVVIEALAPARVQIAQAHRRSLAQRAIDAWLRAVRAVRRWAIRLQLGPSAAEHRA